jgi:peptidyl-prolyl cis-trans isomerase B (cyclophilin B)
MAKKRRARPVTEGIYPVTNRPPGARRRPPPPRPQRSGIPGIWLALGGVAALVAVAIIGYVYFFAPGAAPAATVDASRLHPPAATPLASPPAEPAGDGTTATITTERGTIVIELFTESAPVAAENFINLAEAGFYNGVGFHRIIPGFMIQGGDPEGTGGGGPGYTIPDEPIVGEYVRATVAMARTQQPNSQGSQFFVVVDDSPHLAGGGYTIFGRVTSGMEVADEIVSGARTGPSQDLAVDPVLMTQVTIQRP